MRETTLNRRRQDGILVGVTALGLLIAGGWLAGAVRAADDRAAGSRPYCVVDTGQVHCFSDHGQLPLPPRPPKRP